MQPVLEDIKAILQQARQQTQRAINHGMVLAYWQIGCRIVEEEQQGQSRANYGEQLLKELSRGLSAELGKGFSYANLKNFRQFYLLFPNLEKGYALRSELSWTHYRLIMRVSDPEARTFYLREAADQRWSTRQLERNIKTLQYQRIVAHQGPSGEQNQTVPAEAFMRDPYVLDFLGLPQPLEISETQLESLLVQDLQKFLLELGKGFSFVGRQFRISTETTHYYVDLVFYHYILKCFVLIDLKTDKLSHQDVGQMDMYIRMFDDLKKGKDDAPTLGIILCADKDETMVRYSMLNQHEQLFASRYRTYLPSEEELIAEVEAVKRLNQKLRADSNDELS